MRLVLGVEQDDPLDRPVAADLLDLEGHVQGHVATLLGLEHLADGQLVRSEAFAPVDESDLERAATVLRECGVLIRGPISHGWIPGTSLYFEDLDGHELELFAPST